MKLNKQKLYLLKKRDELIRTLRIEGFSGSDISSIFKIDRSTVSDVLNERNKRDEIRKE